MPSLVTHELCASDALKQCPDGLVKRAILNYPEAYAIGSSGPDLFFFYRVIPFLKQTGHQQMYQFAEFLHNHHVNDVFAQVLHSCQEQKNEERISYLAGWLCHYALDRVAHPYIMYRTGFGTEQDSNDHRRMEAMIDSLLIKKRFQRGLRDKKPYMIISQTKTLAASIHALYQPIAQQFCQLDLTEPMVQQALADMRLLYRILYDPSGWKFAVLKRMERAPYAFTGSIIKQRFTDQDEEADVLNLKKRAWKHPCDETIVSTETFFALYDQGMHSAVWFLTQFSRYLEGADILQTILNEIDDRAYDSGMKNTMPLKYYDLIYGRRESDDTII